MIKKNRDIKVHLPFFLVFIIIFLLLWTCYFCSYYTKKYADRFTKSTLCALYLLKRLREPCEFFQLLFSMWAPFPKRAYSVVWCFTNLTVVNLITPMIRGYMTEQTQKINRDPVLPSFVSQQLC